jgi:hypothetical protein
VKIARGLSRVIFASDLAHRDETVNACCSKTSSTSIVSWKSKLCT